MANLEIDRDKEDVEKEIRGMKVAFIEKLQEKIKEITASDIPNKAKLVSILTMFAENLKEKAFHKYKIHQSRELTKDKVLEQAEMPEWNFMGVWVYVRNYFTETDKFEQLDKREIDTNRDVFLDFIDTLVTKDESVHEVELPEQIEKKKEEVKPERPLLWIDVQKELKPLLKSYIEGEDVVDKIKALRFQDRVKNVFKDVTGEDYEN